EGHGVPGPPGAFGVFEAATAWPGPASAGGLRAREVGERHGFPGPLRAFGGFRDGHGFAGAGERWGVWGAISGPPILINRPDRTAGAGARRRSASSRAAAPRARA